MESAARGGDVGTRRARRRRRHAEDVERGAGDVVTRGARRRRRRRAEDDELEWARYGAEIEEWLERNAEDEKRCREEQERWDEMAALPLAKAGETREDECPICLDDLLAGAGGQKLRTMPCSHSFHQQCIFDWLLIDRRCPICRFVMPSQKRRLLEQEQELVGRQEPAAHAAGGAQVVVSFIFDGSLPHNGMYEFPRFYNPSFFPDCPSS